MDQHSTPLRIIPPERRQPGVPARVRRWALPPAIERGPGETIDRIGILSEHGDAEALLLWRLVRDVELWAATPPKSRGELFDPAAPASRERRFRDSTFPTDVRVHLRRLNRCLASAGGEAQVGEAVSVACAGVAVWAREIGARETAVGFAQAAALVSPEAQYALLTGRCAAELGQAARAATWFSRAVGLARVGRDWRNYTAALVALGALAEGADEPARARRLYLRALRSTRRRRQLPGERARAAHALFRLARDAGDVAAANRFAAIATRAVLKADPGAGVLALTLAEFWTRRGEAGRALRLLDHLDALDGVPAGARLDVAVLRIGAAAAAGSVVTAKRAWIHAWELAAAVGLSSRNRADVLLQLAKCAVELREPGWIAQAGRAALVHAVAEDYPRVHAELLRIADGSVDFGLPLEGAA